MSPRAATPRPTRRASARISLLPHGAGHPDVVDAARTVARRYSSGTLSDAGPMLGPRIATILRIVYRSGHATARRPISVVRPHARAAPLPGGASGTGRVDRRPRLARLWRCLLY